MTFLLFLGVPALMILVGLGLVYYGTKHPYGQKKDR